METVVETNFDELLDVFCHIQEEQLFVPVPAHNNEFYDFILDGRSSTFIQVLDAYKSRSKDALKMLLLLPLYLLIK